MESPDIEKTSLAKPPNPRRTSRLERILAFNRPGENIGETIIRSQQWRILLSTSLMAFTVVGFTQSFGVFQAHYMRQEAVREDLLHREEMAERALISFIGSLGNGGVVAVFGIFYYPRLPLMGKHIWTLCGIGTISVTLGLAAAAASHNIWTLLACHGLLVGIGTGLLLYILAPILPEYFPQHSGLAQGTMYAAAALGGMTWSFVVTLLLDSVGMRKTLGILAGISGLTLSTASALALPPRKFEKRNTKIIGWETFKDPMFTSLALINLIHPLTLAIPMTFGPEFAESLGLGIKQASYLLAVNSGVGIPARLGAGALADAIGHQNTLALATAIYALATWTLWLPSALNHQIGLYIAMSICHGLISGVFNTVSNSALKQLFGDEMYYPKNGAITTIRGIGYVVGVPIAGALVTKVADDQLQGEDFLRPIVYTGVLLIILLACLLHVRWLDARRTGWRWAR